MKNTFLTAILFAAFFTAFAQENNSERIFKPFRVDVAIGYAIPSGSGIKTGGLLAIEPKYSILPQLSLGVRFEGVGTSNAGGNVNDPNVTVKLGVIGSYLATTDYYFKNADFRPFAGLGLGAFSFANISVNISNDAGAVNQDIAGGVKFGGMLRTGFEYRHFRFGLEYNVVGNNYVPPSSSTSNNGYKVKNSYFSIKAGFTFGGGRLEN